MMSWGMYVGQVSWSCLCGVKKVGKYAVMFSLMFMGMFADMYVGYVCVL